MDTNSDAYQEALRAAQLKQWRNKCINDTYEPGSTFKPITLSTALEEGVVTMNTTFFCTGSIMVPGWSKPFKCSKKTGHGKETLMQATGNSCNPAFITIGLKIGTQTYYKYLKSFGLMETTGIDEQGETTGIFASEKSFNSNVVSLASYAFGQTFTITPLQLIRAQAACINGGYLNTPYLVDQILDADGNVISQHTSVPVRQVISAETSANVRACLEYVVSTGTGKNGQVAGYRIGGKTGTADKTGDPNKDVVVSFMCFAPADDPQIIMLITMDSPSRTTGTYVSGGNMVAPTASSVMSEILPYLGIEPDYSAEEIVGADATVPNCVGSTLEQAKNTLKNYGFSCKTVGDGATVTDQTPVGGSIVPNNASILLYLGKEKPDTPCTVPKVVGMTASAANQAVTNAGLIMKVTGATSSSSGNVYAISQSLDPGKEVKAGTVVTVRFGDSSVLD
jgi:stage V sporulation protein D (sporulation-specific penicillin-binding protein)